jgi:rSAM/selenodomain-associated transferase 2
MVMISIIIPAYNEEDCLEQTLVDALRLASEAALQVIVADGGSTDNTVSIASRYVQVVSSPKGKAVQLNTAAREARGDILFFVHADMRLPAGTLQRIDESVNTRGYDGGGFSNVFSSHNRRVKVLGRILNAEIRNREDDPGNTLFFGDNGIFVKTSVFNALGGFRALPIMEDYDFAQRLTRSYRAVRILEPKLIVSPRRQLRAGFVKTHLQWLLISRLFRWGIPADLLAKWYPDVR